MTLRFFPIRDFDHSGFCPIRDFFYCGISYFEILSNSGFCPVRDFVRKRKIWQQFEVNELYVFTKL